ncbi:aldo/keto reductase [Leptospira interrogans]|uniref:Aldo/keto reductase n=16 Tax=Leptospira interrogans TaxID=173 RepID=Q8F1G4_LEPIN|nr:MULTISPECIES: aldo/keto reductase [Leptospira]APH40888.1 Glyoxal reductase [Leptospira interrogans serovar Copenhageni/Icterohaemorrhagiae]EMM97746.1 glyoxal reductase [Leptospira interrogans serovar Zanoni str. LT2156]EMN30532.1 glyoxal reductase [Leptospira interrogans serovar Pyrogenes str. L0374]KAA1267839.1 aldo/keto reductase [Leptospira interrogans serovar Weerasinghe]KAA1291524.1 aldo/keto reductase [Leptospira interrogans serovar Geyaweera]
MNNKENPLKQTIMLNNGISMPILGLGVWKTKSGKECKEAVLNALEAGYRHIDTARIYDNEVDVGQAIRESGIPRKEIFITTKLWNADQGSDKTRKALENSLDRLGIDFVDLYLIHFPVTSKRMDSWKELEKLYHDKLCKAIGVSNYTIIHLTELLKNSQITPAVNQVEFHPFLNQIHLLEYCKKHKIQLEAYSPLAHGQKIEDPTIAKIAQKYDKTPAQILIRWAIEQKIVVIPKSIKKERIIENSKVFDFAISEEDMKILNSLDEDFRTCWDPSEVV